MVYLHFAAYLWSRRFDKNSNSTMTNDNANVISIVWENIRSTILTNFLLFPENGLWLYFSNFIDFCWVSPIYNIVTPKYTFCYMDYSKFLNLLFCIFSFSDFSKLYNCPCCFLNLLPFFFPYLFLLYNYSLTNTSTAIYNKVIKPFQLILSVSIPSIYSSAGKSMFYCKIKFFCF